MISNPAVFIIGASIVFVGSSAARCESWKTYHNVRFGVTAEYPANWVAYPPPENGDGRIFHSPDETATITISGIRASDPLPSELALRAKPDHGETITYQQRGSRAIVVSGSKAGKIFYGKSIVTCGIASDLSIEYPAAERLKYDSLVTHVAASLKAGGGGCR